MLRLIVAGVTLLAGLSAVEAQEWQPKFFLEEKGFVNSDALDVAADGDHFSFRAWGGGKESYKGYVVDVRTGEKRPNKTPLTGGIIQRSKEGKLYFQWVKKGQEVSSRNNPTPHLYRMGYLMNSKGGRVDTFIHPGADIQSAVMSEDGKYVFTAGGEGEVANVCRWEAKKGGAPFLLKFPVVAGREGKMFEEDAQIKAVATNFDGSAMVAAIHTGPAYFSSHMQGYFPLPGSVPNTYGWKNMDVAMTKDGAKIALSRTVWAGKGSSNPQYQVLVWKDVQQEPLILEGHEGIIWRIGFLNDHTLFSVDATGKIGMCDLSAPSPSPQWIETERKTHDAKVSFDGSTIVLKQEGGLQVLTNKPDTVATAPTPTRKTSALGKGGKVAASIKK